MEESKILAGSPQDLSDAAGILKVSRDRINRALLRELAHRHGKAASAKLDSLW